MESNKNDHSKKPALGDGSITIAEDHDIGRSSTCDQKVDDRFLRRFAEELAQARKASSDS